MRQIRLLTCLLTLFFMLPVQSAPAQTASDNFVSCVACHNLPLDHAQGNIGIHAGGTFPPGSLSDACLSNCHRATTAQAHYGAPYYPNFWWNYIDRNSYPGGPSVTTQLCETCHTVGVPPLDTLHTHDQIPYLPSAATPPAPVLPLYEGGGVPNQDPNAGGLVCTTCHNPHEPSYTALSNGKQSYLRVGDITGDTLPLCTTCHTGMGPQLIGHDLFIDSNPASVFFSLPQADTIAADILVRNRGAASYGGGFLQVQHDDGVAAPATIATAAVPPIPAGGSALVQATFSAQLFAEGDVFRFTLDASEMNPVGTGTFVRTIARPLETVSVGTQQGNDYILVDWGYNAGYEPVGDVTFNVYRNGFRINTSPIPKDQTYFYDYNLAPDTPHTYTVEVVNFLGMTSARGDRVGGMTMHPWPGIDEVYVPQDYPTIQEAVNMVPPGTTIHVAPGTYSEDIDFGTAYGVTIQGRDANSTFLDLSGGKILNLDGAGSNTFSRFTVTGGEVVMSYGDTVSEVVFNGSPTASIRGGGAVINCNFMQLFGPSIEVFFGERLSLVNSIFLTDTPFSGAAPQDVYLINNSFPAWPVWTSWPGEGNFSEMPLFVAPGPPQRHFIDYGPGWDQGASVGLEIWYPLDPFFDVGAFQADELYTPRPPTNLNAGWDPAGHVDLDWTASFDSDVYWPMEYRVYRSISPDFPGSDDLTAYASLTDNQVFFEDHGAAPGQTYYYRVRAYIGGYLSAASNTVSVFTGDMAPTADDDFYYTNEDQLLAEPPSGVLLNDTDPQSSPLTAQIVSGPSFAESFTLSSDGSFDYQPLANWSGTDSFTYVASNGTSDSAPATVTIDVYSMPDPPTGVDDSYSMDEDSSYFDVPPDILANDTDPDGDPLQAFVVSGPSHAASFQPYSDGYFEYTPNPDFFGTDSFTYEVSDGTGFFDTATVTITVNPVPDPPVAIADSYTVSEDALHYEPAPGVLGNDTDVDGDTLTPYIISGPGHADTFVLHPDGSFDYHPAYNWSGTDSFTYYVDDGTGLQSGPVSVTITVSPVNDPPETQDNLYIMNEDEVLVRVAPGVLLTASDPDGDTLQAFPATGPVNGQLVLNTDGSLTYTPNPNFFGSDSFTFVANDGQLDSAPATITIGVNNVDDAPVFTPVSPQNVAETGTISIAVSATDADTSTGPYFYPTALPPFCTLNDNSDGTGSVGCNPGYDDAGTYDVTVTALDNATPALDVSETFTLTVTNTNRAPLPPADDYYETTDDTVLTIPATGVLANDVDPDGDDLVALVLTPDPEFDLQPDGSFTYTPTPGYTGTFIYRYFTADAEETSLPYEASVHITVTSSGGVPDPYIHVDAINMGERSIKGKTYYTAVVTVLDEGSSPVAGVEVTGRWSGSGADAASSLVVTVADGTASFTTNGIRKPSGTYTFTVDSVFKAGTVYDAAGSVTSAQYPQTGQNSPPAAAADSAATTVDTPVVVTVLANDIDPDGDALTVTSATDPANGTTTVNGDGTVTYTPDPGYVGADSFSYGISDGRGGSDGAVVDITVSDIPQGGLMHVAAIDLTAGGRKVKKADATVTVVDALGLPVEGVTVSGDWTGALPGTASGMTAADGTAELTSPGAKNVSGQTATFTVTNLSKAGWTYESSADAETSDSIVIP